MSKSLPIIYKYHLKHLLLYRQTSSKETFVMQKIESRNILEESRHDELLLLVETNAKVKPKTYLGHILVKTCPFSSH